MDVNDVKESYDQLAVFYDVLNKLYFLGNDGHYRTELVKHLILKPDSSVLDLCCGTGLNFPYLQQFIKNEGKLVGLDVSLKMLLKAKMKTKHSNAS